MCHADDESSCHSVSAPTPTPLPNSHRAEHFLFTRQTRSAHTCARMGRGAQMLSFHPRARSPSDRDVKPPLSQKQQAPHQQSRTCRNVVALLSEVPLLCFFFPLLFNMLFSPSSESKCATCTEFKCLFLYAPLLNVEMEYDMHIIFRRPWQIALTAYYACFLTSVLFVSLPQ